MHIHDPKSFEEFCDLVSTHPEQIDELRIDPRLYPRLTRLFTIEKNLRYLCKSLSRCTMLKKLSLASCPVGTLPKKSFFMLSNAIGACQSLEILDLSHAALEHANPLCLQYLGRNLFKLSKLYNLALSDNTFDFSKMTRTATLKIESLFDMLSQCHTLTELDLSSMALYKMHKYHAQKLGSALKQLAVLKILNLNANNFGIECLALKHILSSCKTLNALFLDKNNVPDIYPPNTHEDSETNFCALRFSNFCTSLSQCKTLNTIHLGENNFSNLASWSIKHLSWALCPIPLTDIGGLENYPEKLKMKMKRMLTKNQIANRVQLAFPASFPLVVQDIILAYLLKPLACANSIRIRESMAKQQLLNEKAILTAPAAAPLLLSQNTPTPVIDPVQQTPDTTEYYTEWKPRALCNIL